MLTKLESLTITLLKPKFFFVSQIMAKSSFEYVKKFELDDTLLPNSWIVVRLDGKCFHKFSDDHRFAKPNDMRALRLMNYVAFRVMKDYNEILMGFGQSDEYSFVFKKQTALYKRRAAKLLTVINSKFSSSYVYYWNKFFGEEKLQYPPTFDGRVVLYPSDQNLIDYMKWRQADVHINNLYNTSFWNLVLKGNLTPSEAEKRLCGTVSADKNEILFKEFNINYNNEPEISKRGTILLRKAVTVNGENSQKSMSVIVDVHDDMLKDNFWKTHAGLLLDRPKETLVHYGLITDIISEQMNIVNKEFVNYYGDSFAYPFLLMSIFVKITRVPISNFGWWFSMENLVFKHLDMSTFYKYEPLTVDWFEVHTAS